MKRKAYSATKFDTSDFPAFMQTFVHSTLPVSKKYQGVFGESGAASPFYGFGYYFGEPRTGQRP